MFHLQVAMASHRNRGKKARDTEEEQENTSKLDKSSLHENKSAIQCPFSSTSRPELDGGRDPSNSKPSAPKRSEFQHAALPTMELYLYVAFIGFLLFYIQWHIHQISKGRCVYVKLVLHLMINFKGS